MDDIDRFLADLDSFAPPSINAGISLSRSRANENVGGAGSATPSENGVGGSANSRKRSRREEQDATHHHDSSSCVVVPSTSSSVVSMEGIPSTNLPVVRHGGGTTPSPSSSSTTTTTTTTTSIPIAVRIGPQRSKLMANTTATTSSLVWSCAACTYLNENAMARKCAMCASPRPSASSQSSSSSPSSSSWSCVRCTYINEAKSVVCGMCEAPVSRHFASLDTNASLPPPKLTAPTATSPSLFVAAQSTARVRGTTPPPTKNQKSSSSSSSSSSASSDEEDDDDDDDDDDGSDDEHANSADATALVSFLKALDEAAMEDLSMAPIPPTMISDALQPFQRQGLQWLLSREGGSTRNTKVEEVDDDDDDGDGGAYFMKKSAEEVGSIRGGIFADHMGLGKTRTIIALCESTRGPPLHRVTGSEVRSSATLIICPSSVIGQWVQEIRRCVVLTQSHVDDGRRGVGSSNNNNRAPRILVYHGANKRKKLSLFDVAQRYDYVLTSYHTLASEPIPDEGPRTFVGGANNHTSAAFPLASTMSAPTPGKLFLILWKRVVLDEAHMIRNRRTNIHHACLRLSAVHRWAVTGTPIHNHLNDLFALLSFLRVPHFGEVAWWNREVVAYLHNDLHHPRPVLALKLLSRALMLRRTPSSTCNGEVIVSLPPKEVLVELIVLSAEERTFYERVRALAAEKIQRSVERSERGYGQQQHLLYITAFEMLLRCRQACLHPFIVLASLKKKSGSSTTAVDPTQSSSPASTAAMNAAVAEAARREEMMMANFIQRLLRKMDVPDGQFREELLTELRAKRLCERECIICLDHLHPPAILPCAHTFCEGCVRDVFTIGGQKRCPLCKRATTLTKMVVVPEELQGAQPTSSSPASGEAAPRSEADALMQLISSTAAEELADIRCWAQHMCSTKTEKLLHTMRSIPRDEKIVIFSSFLTYLRYVKVRLEMDVDHPYVCDIYSGELSLTQREAILQRFAAPLYDPVTGLPDPLVPRVLLATITTCGVGVNLTSANHCFMMEPTWNPGVEEQALNRLHRIGQTRPVRITKFVAASTVDEQVEMLCTQKKEHQRYCGIGGGQQSDSGAGGSSSRLRTSDLLQLFAPKASAPSTTSTQHE